MKKFKLQGLRVLELTQVIDSIQPKDLATVKDIRMNVALVNDLSAFCKELTEVYSDMSAKQNALLKPFQEDFKKQSEGLEEDEKTALAKEMDVKFSRETKPLLEEMTKKIDELGKVEVEVELSDEKHAKLKEWVEKFAVDKYTDKKIFVQICDVLEIV